MPGVWIVVSSIGISTNRAKDDRRYSWVRQHSLLDDILVSGRNTEEHDERDRLRQVLSRLQAYNATLCADKCIIAVLRRVRNCRV